MNRKNLVSFCCVCVFAILAIASSSSKNLGANSFYQRNKVEDKTVKGNYILTNEGTKITGKEIRWKSGMLTKDQVIMDGTKYKMSEIKGYRENDIYYERHGNEYIKRIVHGKLNIYYNIVTTSSTSRNTDGSMNHNTTTRYYYYVQKGEDGPLKLMKDLDDVKNELSDCPLSMQMLDMKPSKLRKEIKHDFDYLNRAFEIYNNNCKPVKTRY